MRALVLALLFLTAMVVARSGRAQQAQGDLPPELRVPADDPRKGPRLDFMRGPFKCPDEKRFRREVAYWVDGRDHLADDSPDVVRVRFAWTPHGYVASVAYTDAAGNTATMRVTKEGDEHCLLLAKWVALKVSRRIPEKPPPEPCPACPSCPACPKLTACPACVLSCPPPPPPLKRPWYMDLKVGLSAYGMMSWLLTPNVAPGFGVALDARGEYISVAGEFRAVMPSRVLATERVPGASSSFPVEFDLSQLSVLVVPCFRWSYFVGCAVGQVGGFVYRTNVQTLTDVVYSLGPRIGFEVPFAEDRFAFFGFGEVLFTPGPAGIQFSYPPPGMPDGPVANVQWDQPVGSVFFGAGLSYKFK